MTATEYERLVEASPDAIAHVAADGEILAANPAMADLLERDREALAGVAEEHLPEVGADEAFVIVSQQVGHRGVGGQNLPVGRHVGDGVRRFLD